MNDDTRALIDKAERSLDAAEMLCKRGDTDFAVSRAYYAMFYIAEAALLTVGKTFSKHAGVISGFYHAFVATGRIDKKYHQSFHAAFEERTASDYGFMELVPLREARSLIKHARAFVAVVQRLVLPRTKRLRKSRSAV